MTPTQRRIWLAARRTGIGSSDAGPICGMSTHKTAFGIWVEKVYGIDDDADTGPKRWGLKLEDTIAAAYAETTGHMIERPTDIIRSPVIPWLISNPDFHAFPVGAKRRGLELKSSNGFDSAQWGEPGTDQIPGLYIVQTQHQMAAEPDLDQVDVALLMGGSDFRIYHVHRDQGLIDNLLQVEGRFWERVQSRNPPTPDWSHDETIGLLKLIQPADEKTVIQLDAKADELAEAYLTARAAATAAEEAKKVAKGKLLAMMGKAGLGWTPGGVKISRTIVEVHYKTKIAHIEKQERLNIKAPKKPKGAEQ